MAEVVALGTAEEIHAIRERIIREVSEFRANGLKMDVRWLANEKLAVLGCESESDLLFKRCLVSSISELILNQWEDKLVKHILRDEYYFFSPEEKEAIYQRSLQIIQAGHPTKVETMVYQLNRKAKINSRLAEYLEGNNKINIEGFIKFRLKDYVADLEDAVGYAVDEFMMDKEYREFIKLLRYFVDIQEPRLATVHLVIKPGRQYLLFDHNKSEISNQYIDEYFNDLIEVDVNYEDLLISALITIAPRQLVVHIPGAQEAKNDTVLTIEEVFDSRVLPCAGCAWCREKLN